MQLPLVFLKWFIGTYYPIVNIHTGYLLPIIKFDISDRLWSTLTPRTHSLTTYTPRSRRISRSQWRPLAPAPSQVTFTPPHQRSQTVRSRSQITRSRSQKAQSGRSRGDEDEQTDYETAKTRAVQTDISRVCVKFLDVSKHIKFRIHKQVLQEFLACQNELLSIRPALVLLSASLSVGKNFNLDHYKLHNNVR